MKLVRVTEVISPWSGLDKIPEATLQYAADRGTRVHGYCSLISQGEFLVNIDADCRPYVKSFRGWFNKIVAHVIISEYRMNDPALGYTGQIDLLVVPKSEDAIWLIDIKTPLAASKTWKMQMAGYLNLARKHGYTPNRIGSLQLSSEGKPPKMNWYEDSARDFNAFLSALNVYNFINE